MKRSSSFHATRLNTGWVRSVLLILIVLLIGAGILYRIYTTEPEATRETAKKKTPMLVEVTTPSSGTFRPRIKAMGNVRPAKDIILRPRVRGEILEISENFTPGGYLEKEETVVRLDPADYKYTLQQRKNELQKARSELKLEKGRKNVAESEYKSIKEQLSEETNQELVLRKPQLESARADVELAQTAVNQAKLDLQRTSIEAPFHAHVLTRDVNVGSQVAAGDRLARLVGVKRFWVDVRIPLSTLRWIRIPDDPSGEVQSSVQIRDRNSWPENTFRTGRLYKRVSMVGDQSRMAKILVEVPDPLARLDKNENKPELLIDAPVQVVIKGKEITNAVRLNRDYLRKENTVWVMSDGKLDIRSVEVKMRDSEYAYIRSGLESSDQVVKTGLTTITDGAPLRTSPGDENTGMDTEAKRNKD